MALSKAVRAESLVLSKCPGAPEGPVAELQAQRSADQVECPEACSESESQSQAVAWRPFVWGSALVLVFAQRQRLPQL
jgi:hypothetical protein